MPYLRPDVVNKFIQRRIAFFAGVIALIFCPMLLAADYFNGKTVYSENCSQCHGVDGRGVIPGMPDFTMGQGLMTNDAELLRHVKTGKNTMPGFAAILNDREILDVIAYLRMSF